MIELRIACLQLLKIKPFCTYTSVFLVIYIQEPSVRRLDSP